MKILTAFDLKIIALITMIFDHVGTIFFPEVIIFRLIGRVAFVLYAFMLVEGYFHTSNIKVYFSKLFLWAIISEIPYDYAFHGQFFYPNDQNIFLSLLLGLGTIYLIEKLSKIILKIILCSGAILMAIGLKLDYQWYGILTILLFYYLRESCLKFLAIGALSLLASIKLMSLQFFAVFAFFPIILYNGERGKRTGEIYYSFYAIHLTLFGILKYYLT